MSFSTSDSCSSVQAWLNLPWQANTRLFWPPRTTTNYVEIHIVQYSELNLETLTRQELRDGNAPADLLLKFASSVFRFSVSVSRGRRWKARVHKWWEQTRAFTRLWWVFRQTVGPFVGNWHDILVSGSVIGVELHALCGSSPCSRSRSFYRCIVSRCLRIHQTDRYINSICKIRSSSKSTPPSQ